MLLVLQTLPSCSCIPKPGSCCCEVISQHILVSSELVHCQLLQLSDAFLCDTICCADITQCHTLPIWPMQAVPHPEDLHNNPSLVKAVLLQLVSVADMIASYRNTVEENNMSHSTIFVDMSWTGHCRTIKMRAWQQVLELGTISEGVVRLKGSAWRVLKRLTFRSRGCSVLSS